MYAVIPQGAKPSKAVSRDQARPLLCSAHLKKLDHGWELWMTDSYQLVRLPLEVFDADVEPVLTEGPIPVDALKMIERVRGFEANGTVRPVTELGLKLPVLFERPDFGHHVKQFPDLRGLDPGAPKRRLRVGINPDLLIQIAAATGAMGRKVNTPLVLEFDLDHPSVTDGYLRSIRVGHGPSEVGQALLMPIRLNI